MRLAGSQQLRLICHPCWPRKKWVGGLRLQRGGRKFTGRWEEQMYGTQMFAMPYRDNGTQRGIYSPGPAKPPTPTSHLQGDHA